MLFVTEEWGNSDLGDFLIRDGLKQVYKPS